MRKIDNLTYFNLLVLCMWLQVINKVKVRHQGKGHIKVKVKNIFFPSNFMQNFTYFNILILICGYRSLIRSRSHIKVKVTSRSKKNIYIPSNSM